MAPGHVGGVADQHERHAEQRRALHVHLPGHSDLRLVEALGAQPREVRVAEQQPVLVIARAALAHGHRVAARRLERELLRESVRDRLRIERRAAAGEGRRGRLGAADPVDRDAAAREQDELVEAAVHLDVADRLHPRLAAAALVRHAVAAADVGEVAVPAFRVAVDQVAQLLRRPVGRRLGEDVLDRVRVEYLLPEEVRVEVVRADPVAALDVASVGPEEARPLRVHRHVVLRHHAQVVLRERVAVPVARPGEGVRLDVRDAVLGAPDGHAGIGLRRANRGGLARAGAGRGKRRDGAERQRGRDPCEQPSSLHAAGKLSSQSLGARR